MDIKQVITQLESLSNEKVRTMYLKHAGYTGFGIKLGDLRKFAKKLGVNHELALELWKYDNTDVKYLALMICEPNKFSEDEVTKNLSDIEFHLLANEYVNKVLLRYDNKDELASKWIQTNDDNLRYGAFNIISQKAKDRIMSDGEIEMYLEMIYNNLKTETQYSQWAMNQLLCYIGIYNSKYTTRCINIGEELGVYADVKVAKGCTSAYAPAWINKLIEKSNF